MRSSNGGSDSTNNTVGSGKESAPSSPYLQDGREGTGGVREGEPSPPSHAPSYSTSTSDSGEGVAQPVRSGGDRRNLEWMEGLPEWTAGRTRGEMRAGALLARLESAREEMYAFNVDNAPSPREFECGCRLPIGLQVGQAEGIPPNWADIQKSEFYEEWLNAMILELDGRVEIGTISADVVPKGVNAITEKWVFAWKTSSDGYVTKAKARWVARDFGSLAWTISTCLRPPQPCHLLKWHSRLRCRMTGRCTILMFSKILFRQNSTSTHT